MSRPVFREHAVRRMRLPAGVYDNDMDTGIAQRLDEPCKFVERMRLLLGRWRVDVIHERVAFRGQRILLEAHRADHQDCGGELGFVSVHLVLGIAT